MGTILLAAVLACSAPPQTTTIPPAPPPVTYDVWGFRWDGHQYVREPTRSLSTTDLKTAVDYATQLTSYAGWTATTNLPKACVVHTIFHGPAFNNSGPTAFPDQPTYSVWAYKLSDGSWVKDEKYSWTTHDPLLGLAYAKKVSAVAGWSATTNCPEPVEKSERYVDGGIVHGADHYRGYAFRTCEAEYRPRQRTGQHRIFVPWLGWISTRGVVSNGMDNDASYDYSNFAPYDSSSDIQNMVRTQDMLNQQQMNNNLQDMLNTQNMINTQNMVNNMQEMVNTQNAIDTQNMINAMNANP